MSKANKSNNDELVKLGADLDEQNTLSPLAQLIHDGLYLDRSLELKELYDNTDSRYDCIIRPKGFGKRILADTLEALFTHDYDITKHLKAYKKWQEPYCQVVRLDLEKISNKQKYLYPTIDLSQQEAHKFNNSNASNWSDYWHLNTKEQNNFNENKSSESLDDIYTFNSKLYTLLFNEITKNTAKELPIGILKGSDFNSGLEDFSTMLSECSESSAMVQIKDLLARCHNNSRVLIIENLDAPFLSALHNPRAYNYRSRVFITFINILGYFKKVFRHIIFMGTVNIDYRKFEYDYPQYMSYLPLSRDFGFSNQASTLLGFTKEDLLSEQYAPYLQKALSNIKEKSLSTEEKSLVNSNDIVDFMMQLYGGYSFNKLDLVINPSDVIAFFRSDCSTFRSYWFTKNVPNFNYLARVCRITHEDMLTLTGVILSGNLSLSYQDIALPALINNVGLENFDNKLKDETKDTNNTSNDQKESSSEDNVQPSIQSIHNKILNLMEDADGEDSNVFLSDNLVIDNDELDDLEHSEFAQDADMNSLNAEDDITLLLEENGQAKHQAISNEYESVAQLRRAHDEEVLAQGYPGLPYPILMAILGYITNCKVVHSELISNVVNSEVLFSLCHIIITHYFKEPVRTQRNLQLSAQSIFPFDAKNFKDVIEPVIKSIRLDHFNQPINAKTIRALLRIWLQINNVSTPSDAMLTNYPYLKEVIAKRQAQNEANKFDPSILTGLPISDHVPTNELELALFNAQEQKLKQTKRTFADSKIDNDVSSSKDKANNIDISLNTDSQDDINSSKQDQYVAVIVEDIPNQKVVNESCHENTKESLESHISINDELNDQSFDNTKINNDIKVEQDSNKLAISPSIKLDSMSDQDELNVLDTLSDLLEEEDAHDKRVSSSLNSNTNQEQIANGSNKNTDCPDNANDKLLDQKMLIRSRRLRMAKSNINGKIATKHDKSTSQAVEDVVILSVNSNEDNLNNNSLAQEPLAKGSKANNSKNQKQEQNLAALDKQNKPIAKDTYPVSNASKETNTTCEQDNSLAELVNSSVKLEGQNISIKINNIKGASDNHSGSLLVDQDKNIEPNENEAKLDNKRNVSFNNDDLNGFNNIAIIPKRKVSARLINNLQDLNPKQAQVLWENLNTILVDPLSKFNNSSQDEINNKIIFNWQPYLNLEYQLEIIAKAPDCIQKAQELERIGSLAIKQGNNKVVKSCEQRLAAMSNRSVNNMDYAQGKDLGSLVMSQMNLLAKHKHPIEANFIFLDLFKIILTNRLISCLGDAIKLINANNKGNNFDLKSKIEYLDYVNVETSEDRKLTFKQRALKINNFSLPVIKEFALQKLLLEAKLAKDIEAISFIKHMALEASKQVKAQMGSLDINKIFDLSDTNTLVISSDDDNNNNQEAASNDKGDQNIDEVPNKEEQTKLHGKLAQSVFDSLEKIHEQLKIKTFQLSNKPALRPLQEYERILLQLNHQSLMVNSAYNSHALDEHCNLTIFNEENALVLEIEVVNQGDDEKKIIAHNAMKIGKVRHPLANILGRSPLDENKAHTISLSLVAKIDHDQCSLLDLKKVRDNQESAAIGDVMGANSNTFYRNIQNSLLSTLDNKQSNDVVNAKVNLESLKKAQPKTRSVSKSKEQNQSNLKAKDASKQNNVKDKKSKTCAKGKEVISAPKAKRTSVKVSSKKSSSDDLNAAKAIKASATQSMKTKAKAKAKAKSYDDTKDIKS